MNSTPRSSAFLRPKVVAFPSSQATREPREREEVAPPSEETIRRLASDLDVDSDVLLALAGKVSADLMETIRRRPALFAELIRQLRDMPDHAVLRLVREVRDGEW